MKLVIWERKNKVFVYWLWGYYLLFFFLVFFIGVGWVFFVFVLSSLWVWFFYGRDWFVKMIGILEIVNVCFFFVVMCMFIIR